MSCLRYSLVGWGESSTLHELVTLSFFSYVTRHLQVGSLVVVEYAADCEASLGRLEPDYSRIPIHVS